jgi:hypothetical protein
MREREREGVNDENAEKQKVEAESSEKRFLYARTCIVIDSQ